MVPVSSVLVWAGDTGTVSSISSVARVVAVSAKKENAIIKPSRRVVIEQKRALQFEQTTEDCICRFPMFDDIACQMLVRLIAA